MQRERRGGISVCQRLRRERGRHDLFPLHGEEEERGAQQSAVAHAQLFERLSRCAPFSAQPFFPQQFAGKVLELVKAVLHQRHIFHDEPRRYLFARNDKLYIGDRESRLREIFTGSGVEAAQKPQRRFNLIFAEPARAAPLIRASGKQSVAPLGEQPPGRASLQSGAFHLYQQ